MLKSAAQAIPPIRRIDLYTHYNDKEHLKKYNDVFFDKDSKKWYVNTDHPKLNDILEQWSPVKLKVPYSSENIDLLKS